MPVGIPPDVTQSRPIRGARSEQFPNL